jgi:predicted Zn-dependent protease
MSQDSIQQQTTLREKAHQTFDMVREFARQADEVEITLTSSIGEHLRFGNNELGQSQYTTSKTLSVRLATGKRQARTTTGRMDKSFIEKAVEKALSQAKTAPEDPDYLSMLGPQKYPTVNRYHKRTVEESAEAKASHVGYAIDLAKKNGLLASGVLTTDADQVWMLNSSGMEASYEGTNGYFSLTMDANNGNQTGFAMSTFHGHRRIEA